VNSPDAAHLPRHQIPQPVLSGAVTARYSIDWPAVIGQAGEA
jgi:hypothetical protein